VDDFETIQQNLNEWVGGLVAIASQAEIMVFVTKMDLLKTDNERREKLKAIDKMVNDAFGSVNRDNVSDISCLCVRCLILDFWHLVITERSQTQTRSVWDFSQKETSFPR
jgi:hypothetical protein